MIHVFVGTKAQFIKMAPIMQALDQQGIIYNFIDAGQHRAITQNLVPEFELRQPDISLRDADNNITTIIHAVWWTFQNLLQIIFRPKTIFNTIFKGQKGVCLIHGDTLTTLLSLLYAKRCGLKVAHVEAGMRSFHLFDPFPEEMIRLIAMRFSDILFAPTADTFHNLKALGYEQKSVRIAANTIMDTVRYAQTKIKGENRPSGRYVVVTTHRVETIYSRQRLNIIVDLLTNIAQERQVLFVLHEPTRQQLERFSLLTQLEQNPAIILHPLQPYLVFVDLLAGADFVVTDGGSIQEECYLLNVPCLIMRNQTEHQQGLGKIAYLAEFDQAQIAEFLRIFPTLKRDDNDDHLSPSSEILERVLVWA